MKGTRLNRHSKSCKYSHAKFIETAIFLFFCLFLSIFFAGCHFFNGSICEKYRNLRLDLACYWGGGDITPWEIYEVSPKIVKPLYEQMKQGLKNGNDCVHKEDRIVKSTLLMTAAFYGDIDGMRYLLEVGFPIDEMTDITKLYFHSFASQFGGESALHFAARGEQKEAYDFLVRHGANELLENANGETPMECWGKIPQEKYGEGIIVGEDGHLLYKYNHARVIDKNGHLDQKESDRYEEWKEQQKQVAEQNTVPSSNKPKS